MHFVQRTLRTFSKDCARPPVAEIIHSHSIRSSIVHLMESVCGIHKGLSASIHKQPRAVFEAIKGVVLQGDSPYAAVVSTTHFLASQSKSF